MTEYLTSSITYSILPPLLTSTIQSTLYSNNILTPRQPNSPQFHRDRKLIYTLLVIVYFVYTVYTAFTTLDPTYYDILGVPIDVHPTDLRSRFKQLSKLYHPDKSSESSLFLTLRHAYQVLNSPIKRLAYETFGPSILHRDLPTHREYLLRGLLWSLLPGYLISFIALQVYSLFGRGGQTKYWRYLLFLGILVFEVRLIMRPGGSACGMPRFVLLKILHKVVITTTVALDHLAALYTPAMASDVALSRLEGAVIGVLNESNRAMAEEIGCVIEGVQDGEERKRVVDEMKTDIVKMLANQYNHR